MAKGDLKYYDDEYEKWPIHNYCKSDLDQAKLLISYYCAKLSHTEIPVEIYNKRQFMGIYRGGPTSKFFEIGHVEGRSIGLRPNNNLLCIIHELAHYLEHLDRCRIYKEFRISLDKTLELPSDFKVGAYRNLMERFDLRKYFEHHEETASTITYDIFDDLMQKKLLNLHWHSSRHAAFMTWLIDDIDRNVVGKPGFEWVLANRVKKVA
jgi:hypothetical protein